MKEDTLTRSQRDDIQHANGVAGKTIMALERCYMRAEKAEAERDEAIEALRFYANPVIYQPHPHGPAFDRRDMSYAARAVLAKLKASP